MLSIDINSARKNTQRKTQREREHIEFNQVHSEIGQGTFILASSRKEDLMEDSRGELRPSGPVFRQPEKIPQ